MEEMIAEHGDQLNALFSSSASKEDVDAAASLVAEMDGKLAAEMEVNSQAIYCGKGLHGSRLLTDCGV